MSLFFRVRTMKSEASRIAGVHQALLERDVKTVTVVFRCKTEYAAIEFHDTIEKTMRAGYLSLNWINERIRVEGHDQ